MKVKFTKHFPFGRFVAMCLFNTIYYKASDYKKNRLEYFPEDLFRLVQHERTHHEQQKELLYIPFFILYVLEWLFKLPTGHAYRNISFEREARVCQKEQDNYDIEYHHDKHGNLKSMDYTPRNDKGSLINRKHYSWTKYIFHDERNINI